MLPLAFEGRWRARGALANAVTRLIKDLAAVGRTRRRREGRDAEKFAACVDALVCNFAAIAMASPGRSLVTARRTRAEGSGLHGKTFVRTLDAMEDAGLIEQWRGSWSVESSRHEISRSRATPALLAALPAALNADCIGMLPGPVLDLHSRKNAAGQTKLLPFPDTAETNLLAAEADAVNAWLTRANVRRRDGVELFLVEAADRLPTIASLRAWSLRRVFNHSTLAHGGRLAGGWWLGMSQRERADRILIDGEPMVELDFVCMVPRVCYALRGVPWPFGDDRDAPYIVGPHASRDAWKKWVNSMLFARRALGAWVGKTMADRLAFAAKFGGIDWPEARALVLRRHAALAEAGGFGCELGMLGMRAESDIAVDVVLRLRDQGVPCLPIHDGFAVAASKADVLREAMVVAAVARLGVPLAVAIK